MYNNFLKYIKDNNLFSPENKVLLAVSGGKDSMVMIRLFQMAGFDFGVAHFNHKTRDGESDLDQEFVKEYAKKNSLLYYSVAIDIDKRLQAKKGANFQDVARKYRYNWLEKIRKTHGYDFIATAHHFNDNIETFLYRMSRGSGINGLLGINSQNGFIVRPVLSITRDEIEEFVIENQVPFREDSSNLGVKYDRNFIRHRIIPQFKELNSNFNKRVGVTIDNLKKTNSLFDYLLMEYSQKFISEIDNLVYIDKNIVNEIKDKEDFLFFILSKYGFNSTEVSNIFSAFNKTGTIFKNDRFELLIDRNEIVIRTVEISKNSEFDIKIGVNRIGENLLLKVEEIEYNSNIKFDNECEYLDLCNMTFPLKLRKWKAGDRFKPYGLKGKSKKIKDYFIDKKLSRFEKNNMFLLLNNNEICMILDMGIAYDYRVKKSSESLIKISLSKTLLKNSPPIF